jgi:hypothetical protein
MHAVSIKAGGIVPLPRVGGALSHAVGSIRNLPRHCQTGVLFRDQAILLSTPNGTCADRSRFVEEAAPSEATD